MARMVPWPGFIGGSAVSQSPLADCERTINWYPERIDSPTAQTPYALYPTPGQQQFAQTMDTNVKALLAINGRCIGVVGGFPYEIFATKLATRRGTGIAQDGNPATISFNGVGNQFFITSGTNGYILDGAANTVTQVLTGGAVMGGMIDGYFLAFDPVASKFRVSALNNGTSWDPTQFVQRSTQPDPWRCMLIGSNRDAWMIGELTGEVWYDAGTFPFPFAPYPGASFKYGILAPFSAALVGDAPMWLARNADGVGVVVKAGGYSPQVVSTKAVATAIANYARTSLITDARAFAYQDQGHLFYVLTFPTANATWVWDDTEQLWSERGTWIAAKNAYDAWHPSCHAYAFGQHLVGLSGGSVINTLDVTFGLEDGATAIRRQRIAPALNAKNQRITIRTLELYLQTGLGTATGQGSDPQIMVEKSPNAGQTYGNIRTVSAGLQGQYGKRARLLKFGSGRDQAIRVTVTDPIPWRISNALVNATAMAA